MKTQAHVQRVVRLVSTELLRPPEVAGTKVRCPKDAGQLIASFIGNKDREHVVAIHLSAQSHVLGMEVVSIGDQTSAPMNPREAFKAALLMNAFSIVFGHNHPSGDLTPSPSDLVVHKQLREAGELIGISVVDFLIVAGERWHSLAETP